MLRLKGSGDAFGEIGLLSGISRTATVIATSDGQLLAAHKTSFLDLVADATDRAFPTFHPYMGRAPARTPDPGADGGATQ